MARGAWIGRSIMRAVKMARSVGRPSRLKKPPGIFPAAYMRSSTSTVSGKKSAPSRPSIFPRGRRDHRVPGTHEHGAVRLLGELPGLERHFLLADGDGDRRESFSRGSHRSSTRSWKVEV